MNNDLISREALKEDKVRLIDVNTLKYKNLAEVNGRLTYVLTAEEIDNAPTVEEKSYAMGYQDGLEDGLDGIIPKGEWEEPFEMNGKTYHKCNHCHISSELILIDKFCPNCGAKMKGGAE